MFFTLNKKSFIKFLCAILFFFLLSLLLIFIVNLLTTKTQTIINTVNRNTNTVEVSSLPISNKTIILDAGHGLPDGGAVSNLNSNIIESSLNLNKHLFCNFLLFQFYIFFLIYLKYF